MLRRTTLLTLALLACGSPGVTQAPAASPPAASNTSAATAVATAGPSNAAPDIAAALASPDRDEADRALDAGRKPGETFAFFGVFRGARVAELAVGGGYSTELLARIVGDEGVVFAQNSKLILDRFAAAPWAARLKKPVLHRVVRVDREFDDPLPAEARELDGVFIILFYHDLVWMKADRARLNSKVFAALRSGGTYGIVDHAAQSGHGLDDVETLHRIEERVLRQEVEAAGFRLASRGTFLANPADTKDWSASPRTAGERRGTSDRFVLRFVKP